GPYGTFSSVGGVPAGLGFGFGSGWDQAAGTMASTRARIRRRVIRGSGERRRAARVRVADGRAGRPGGGGWRFTPAHTPTPGLWAVTPPTPLPGGCCAASHCIPFIWPGA